MIKMRTFPVLNEFWLFSCCKSAVPKYLNVSD